MSDTQFRVLGPIEALRGGAPLRLGGPRQQALLALLLVERDRFISADRLAEELWHGALPPGAEKSLRSYVTRLRHTLGHDVPIVGSKGGYALEIPREQVDAFRFETLIGAGEEALARGAAARARDRLDTALALWRGRPFGELGGEGLLRVEANRLEELRLFALEQRLEADLQLGRSGELVDELEKLASEYPEREAFWRQLMLALYRSGRQAEALEAYRDAREYLHDELGLEPGESLRQLERAVLRQDVEQVRPHEERHNLPAPATSFVGRRAELDEIRRTLGESRVVTLTGVGGAGKTRLALEAAARSVAQFTDGVRFCDLALVSGPEGVITQVADALEVVGEVDVEPEAAVIERLRAAELLLVLDNCEHVREASAVLVAKLVTAAQDLYVLATSREVLGVPGEVDFAVPPLPLPVGGGEEDLRASEAVALFSARARAANPKVRDDDAALATAARICRDLDGLPLAIELAAARAKTLSLDEIASRLDDRFRFLVSWRRLTAARHRTLEEAIGWSFDLLDEESRSMLARLSVFAGSFSLLAATEIAADGGELRALEHVERLVDSSLVVPVEHGFEMRYRLLETVRHYARDRLAERELTLDVERRHAEYYLRRAEELHAGVEEHGTQHVAALDPDDANVQAALDFLRRYGPPEHYLRLTAALWRYWWLRGRVRIGRRELEAALAGAPGVATPARVDALRGASTLALRQGDEDPAARLAAEAVQRAGELDDPLWRARALVAHGNALSTLGRLERAEEAYREAASLFETAGRSWGLANVLLNLADLALGRGRYEDVETFATASLEISRSFQDDAGIAVNLTNMALAALALQDPRRARELLREGLERASSVGFGEWMASAMLGLAAAASALGENVTAARLLGASARLFEEVGSTPDELQSDLSEQTLAQLRARLGDDAFARERQAGMELSTPEAVELALATAV